MFFVSGMDQLVKVARFPIRRFFLVHKLQVILIELFKEGVPGNLLQLFVFPVRSIRQLEAENSRVRCRAPCSQLCWVRQPRSSAHRRIFTIACWFLKEPCAATPCFLQIVLLIGEITSRVTQVASLTTARHIAITTKLVSQRTSSEKTFLGIFRF